MVRTVFVVPELRDRADAARLTRALLGVEGVEAVTVEAEGQRVWVEHDAELTSVEALWIRLDHIGLTPR